MASESDAVNSTKTFLPGFGRPLNHVPSEGHRDYIGDCFASALSSINFENNMLPLTTVREFVMLQFMNTITDKPDWHIKINNSDIAAKWKEEALASNHEDLTPKIIDYCLDELRYKSTLIPTPPAQLPPVVVYNGDVVKSDTALSLEFKEELQQAVKIFEANIPERLRDWHPGSDGKVWDLVHPSLFSLIYGRTRVLENGEHTRLEDCIDRCGKGAVTEIPPKHESVEFRQKYGRKAPYSRKFQWLPCEVDISGEETKITSYINNLHPQKEKPIYRLIEKLIDASIPLWDLTLAPLQAVDFIHHLRITYDFVKYKEDTKEGGRAVEDEDDDDDDEDNGDGDDEDSEDNDSEDWDTQLVIRPEPKAPFAPLPSPTKFSLREKYGKHGLQIIIKMANIELTPEKPNYEGGSWHIEGQLNEHIVTTALYYYSDSNITPSNLSFRQWFSEEDTKNIKYERNKSAWLNPIYGCEDDGPSAQDIGSVDTCEGRLLTFPNILQHRVGPFKLADPTKPGHKKIVALFLVDPHIKIISTAHVPCQQQEWWWEQVGAQASEGVGLPRELQDYILKDVDFPISLQEAKSLREELIEERKAFSFAHSKSLDSHFTISLCERPHWGVGTPRIVLSSMRRLG